MANLQPARTKWRKHRKGKIRGNATACNTLDFGDFGIQSLDRARIPANQIEAARIAISRALKRKGKMWMRIFPHTPVTRKPAEVRMGSGKGSVEYYVAVIKPGTMMFEVAVSPSPWPVRPCASPTPSSRFAAASWPAKNWKSIDAPGSDHP